MCVYIRVPRDDYFKRALMATIMIRANTLSSLSPSHVCTKRAGRAAITT